MSLALLGGLAVLALIDSTSIGTLVIPLWLLLVPGRVNVARMLGYLTTITAFYWVVGVGLLFAARSGLSWFDNVSDSPVFGWAELLVGLSLFAVSWLFDSKRRRKQGKPDRTARWRERALDSEGSNRRVATLALAAGLTELVTMVPYLAAIGLMVATGLSPMQSLPVLAGYALVMILPAVILLGLRVVAHRQVVGLLRRVDAFLTRNADSAVGWTLAIVGLLIASDAYGRLF